MNLHVLTDGDFPLGNELPRSKLRGIYNRIYFFLIEASFEELTRRD